MKGVICPKFVIDNFSRHNGNFYKTNNVVDNNLRRFADYPKRVKNSTEHGEWVNRELVRYGERVPIITNLVLWKF